MSKKLAQALLEGKISKEEYNRRMSQANKDKKAKQVPKIKNGKMVKMELVQKSSRGETAIPKAREDKSDWTSGSTSGPVSNPASCYANMLVCPKNTMCRYPDSFNRKTALFRSTNVFYPTLTIDSSVDSGRFSMALQPKLGARNTPANFQLAVVKPSALTGDWSTFRGWDSVATYESGQSGTDPRIDVNENFLTAPNTGYFAAVYSKVNPTTTNGFFEAGSTIALDADNNGIAPLFTDPNVITLPFGEFIVTVTATMISGTAGATQYYLASIAGTTVQVQNSGNNFTPVTAYPTLSSPETISRSFEVVSTPGGNTLAIGILQGGVQATVIWNNMSTLVTISNANFLSVNPTLNSGAIEQLRPVAQSLLVTYMGPELTDGGSIASCYVPPDYLTSNYFNNASDQNQQAQLFENLMKIEGCYNGRLAKGTYAWWTPYDPSNVAFQTVSQHNAFAFPGIICSGVFTPVGSTIASGVNSTVLRVEVNTVYEFITKSTAFDSAKLIGSQQIIDSVDNLLMEQPHCMANGDHLKFIRDCARGVYSWANRNKNWLMPVGQAILATML